MLDTSGGFFPDKLKEHVSMELFGNLDKSISTTNPRPFAFEILLLLIAGQSKQMMRCFQCKEQHF